MDIFIEIIVQRIIVRFFGYYTLLLFFKIFRNEKGLQWLNDSLENEGEEFGRGCMIGIVGLISFFIVIMTIAYFYDMIFS